MNVEDEFFTAIENRDTTIMNNEREIAEQRAYINEQKCQINEQQNQLNEQQSQLNEKNKMLQSAIKAMMNNGLDVATIATSLGITAGEVEALMAKQTLAKSTNQHLAAKKKVTYTLHYNKKCIFAAKNH